MSTHDEMTARVDALVKDAADRGKLIEVGWLSLRRVAIPLDAPQMQLDEMRHAFFAGAQHLFSCINSFAEDTDDGEPTDDDVRRMDLINEELNGFIEDFKLRHLPTAGRT